MTSTTAQPLAGAEPAAHPTVTLRYFAAAQEAAGMEQEQLPLRGHTLGEVLGDAGRRHPALVAILPACSYLVDRISAGPVSPVGEGCVVDVLPPFAGG